MSLFLKRKDYKFFSFDKRRENMSSDHYYKQKSTFEIHLINDVYDIYYRSHA